MLVFLNKLLQRRAFKINEVSSELTDKVRLVNAIFDLQLYQGTKREKKLLAFS